MDGASHRGIDDGVAGAVGPADGVAGEQQQRGAAEQPVADRPVRAAILELLANGGGASDESQDPIANLQGQRKELLEERKRLTRALRNETRKRKRMLNKSARLSNADLVEVLQIRQNRAVAKAKAAAA